MVRVWCVALVAIGGMSEAQASVCSTGWTDQLQCNGDEITVRASAYNERNFDGYSCTSSSQLGGETYVKFQCPTTGPVRIEMDNGICDVDFFVLSNACTSGSCLARNTQSHTRQAPAQTYGANFNCVAGNTYYISLEAYGPWNDWYLPGCNNWEPHPDGFAGQSSYVDVTFRAICDEVCDDGDDNDHDGDIDCDDDDCECVEDCAVVGDEDGNGLWDCDDPACFGTAYCCDEDGDGYDADTSVCGWGGDCDDSDPDVSPGADDVPADGIDQNCDEVDACFEDLDLDGYGSEIEIDGVSLTCGDGTGEADNDLDCVDTGPGAASIYPGADDVPGDGVDQDCDGVDTCFVDDDGDGWGTEVETLGTSLDCDVTGTASRSGDCADVGLDAFDINLDAVEICNGRDDDCDGLVDDDDEVTDAPSWYVDLDGDGFAGETPSTTSCDPPAGLFAVGDDCRDVGAGAAAIYPGADEVPADGVDQDCDDADDCFVDDDGDGFGTQAQRAASSMTCDEAGLSWNDDDCLDTSTLGPSVNPDAQETCNNYDDDCDGLVDDEDLDVAGEATWFFDADGDGFAGDLVTVSACDAPADHYADAEDCDDGDAFVSPDAEEICNEIDDDCDELVDQEDDDLVESLEVFLDSDADGHGDLDVSMTIAECEPPDGWVISSDDCDDDDPDAYPLAPEVPYDEVDQDCDGFDLVDVDGDGVAGGPDGTDCVDLVATIFPGAVELADGVDQDCDGEVDDGTERYDDDGDGVTELGGDCDDADASAFPGGLEACNGVDNDCDGEVDEGTSCYDDDNDGYTEDEGDCHDGERLVNPGAVDIAGSGVDSNCDGILVGGDGDGDGYTTLGGDCDDTDAQIRPGATEVANGIDDDCDDAVDEGTLVYDDDFDGFAESAGDCDDSNALINPLVPEVVDNGRDDNCDGVVDEGGTHVDDDRDGFSDDAGDCDDANDTVFPYASELGNGVDDDCDGLVDENVDDADQDGWTVEEGDCNDQNGWVRPDAVEVCDGVDNNCNGVNDEGCQGDALDTDEDKAPESSCDVGQVGLGGWWLLVLAVAQRRRRPEDVRAGARAR